MTRNNRFLIVSLILFVGIYFSFQFLIDENEKEYNRISTFFQENQRSLDTFSNGLEDSEKESNLTLLEDVIHISYREFKRKYDLKTKEEEEEMLGALGLTVKIIESTNRLDKLSPSSF